MMKKDFDEWNKEKKKTHGGNPRPYAISDSAAAGTLVVRGVEYDGKRQRENRHVEIKKIHSSYKFFTNTMLSIQKSVAKSNPEIMLVVASGANCGTRNGTTAEAIHTCPRSAAMPETTFVCEGDNEIIMRQFSLN